MKIYVRQGSKMTNEKEGRGEDQRKGKGRNVAEDNGDKKNFTTVINGKDRENKRKRERERVKEIKRWKRRGGIEEERKTMKRGARSFSKQRGRERSRIHATRP